MVLEYNLKSTWTCPLRELWEMHHVEAVVAKRWSEKAESPPSTLCRTSHDIQADFMRKRGSGSRSVGIGWEDMILPGVEDPQSRTERVRSNVGKDRVCIFIVWYDEMEMRWCLSTAGSTEYILPVTLSTFVTPVSPYTCRCSLKIYLEAVIERVWRCTWILSSSKLRDALAGRDRASLEMHSVTERWSELTDALGGRDWASLETHLEAAIEWTQRCTWKL